MNIDHQSGITIVMENKVNLRTIWADIGRRWYYRNPMVISTGRCAQCIVISRLLQIAVQLHASVGIISCFRIFVCRESFFTWIGMEIILSLNPAVALIFTCLREGMGGFSNTRESD